MSWVKDAVVGLETGDVVKVRPLGGSMRGRIESGQLVTIAPITANDVKVDDVVFIRWKGNFILHIVKEIGEQGFLIGNNVGKINGWASREDVLGVVIEVAPQGQRSGSITCAFRCLVTRSVNAETRKVPRSRIGLPEQSTTELP